ncbi:MAG: hypothetical protein ACXABY_26290 [Candidatus Thorarchaeota archaeon]|jgi:hypothetical protein
MEPLTILAAGKFFWEVAQEIRKWVKEAEAHPDMDTGFKKHDYVLRKAGQKIVDNPSLQDVDNREIMDVLNPKIEEVVKGLKDSGALKGE